MKCRLFTGLSPANFRCPFWYPNVPFIRNLFRILLSNGIDSYSRACKQRPSIDVFDWYALRDNRIALLYIIYRGCLLARESGGAFAFRFCTVRAAEGKYTRGYIWPTLRRFSQRAQARPRFRACLRAATLVIVAGHNARVRARMCALYNILYFLAPADRLSVPTECVRIL